jgi:flagellar motor switch protein FliM
MKPLSIESIRSSAIKAPTDLSVITRGFQLAAYSISKMTSGWSSVPIYLSVDSLDATNAISDSSQHTDALGISKILDDPETGVSLRINLTKELAQMFCEAVIGGDFTQTPDTESRPISQIENDVGQIFIKVVVEKLVETFAFPQTSKFVFEVPAEKGQVSEKPIFKPTITAKLNVQIGSRDASFSCELSAEFGLLVNSSVPDATPTETETNSGWSTQINTLLEPTSIEIVAVLTELRLKLNTISNLRIGQTIPLGVNYKNSLIVRTSDIDLYTAHLGQSNGNYCLVVDGSTTLK